MNKFYYVAAISNKDFIKNIGQYAIKSLIKTGISLDDIHVIINDDKDHKLLKNFIPSIRNFYKAEIDIGQAKWKYAGGKRKYSLLKLGGICKFFGKPIYGRYMVFFDGDVLWYKDPTPFFETKCEKTWFHHGKSRRKHSLAGREGMTEKDINPFNYEQLCRWFSKPQAYLMYKWGAKKVAEREVCSGLYVLHPRDHEQLLSLTYKGVLINSQRFIRHEGGGDQKPMNAALNTLEIDWHGGSRFFCPEHEQYFEHFFGAKDLKEKMHTKIKEMHL